MFKKTIIAGLTAAALGSGLTQAQQPAAAPASPHTLTGNIGLYSQYIFRGMTQTNREPALQGGFDYSHSSGFYAGTWGSNISWLRDGAPVPAYNAGGSLELDIYAGYKAAIGKSDFILDVGGLYYWYPGDATPRPACVYGTATACPKGDTIELYTAVGWKWLVAKYSVSLGNETFGLPSSRGTSYFDLTATVPLGESGFTAVAHYGKQRYSGNIPGYALGGAASTSNDAAASYEDWKLGISYALPKDFTIGAYYTDTSGANRFYYGSVGEGGPFPRNMTKGTGTVYIQKTF